MCSNSFPSVRPVPTVSEEKETVPQCRQSRSPTTGPLSEVDVLTDEQWQFVVRYLNRATKYAEFVCNTLAKKGTAYEEHQIYADAENWLIIKASKIVDVKTKVSFFRGLNHLPKKLHQLQCLRNKRRRECQPEEDWQLNTIRQLSVESVEDFIDTEPPFALKEEYRQILLKIVYRRSDERISTVLSRSERRIWRNKVKPALKKWLREEGVLNGNR